MSWKTICLTLVGPVQLQIGVSSGNARSRVCSPPWEVRMSVWARTDLYGLRWNMGYNVGKKKKGWDGQQVSAMVCWAPPAALGCAARGGLQSSVMWCSEQTLSITGRNSSTSSLRASPETLPADGHWSWEEEQMLGVCFCRVLSCTVFVSNWECVYCLWVAVSVGIKGFRSGSQWNPAGSVSSLQQGPEEA